MQGENQNEPVVVHTYPVDDLREHNRDSGKCWCGPMVERVETVYGGYAWTIVHNAADGRGETIS